ncbi:uncharacterized protein PADG_04517 [Paracoccidioides brasiliensis Pb18]|uniref:Uncharacterized protein n=1 Tax=Paracoccidioides brasiliensis (strain Pb18) TaxID=502780 RepID=C1GBZ5_PARBD|nr:uncharacterized protein PADG_04517 [Paracoccidioides brasiliensis Pb18]EEH48438.2 hypothetical protein PADG_04517 [Paracoccidioides brasiliensis Pb18]
MVDLNSQALENNTLGPSEQAKHTSARQQHFHWQLRLSWRLSRELNLQWRQQMIGCQSLCILGLREWSVKLKIGRVIHAKSGIPAGMWVEPYLEMAIIIDPSSWNTPTADNDWNSSSISPVSPAFKCIIVVVCQSAVVAPFKVGIYKHYRWNTPETKLWNKTLGAMNFVHGQEKITKVGTGGAAGADYDQ